MLKGIADRSVDLVIIDPPYEYVCGAGGGAFGSDKRNYHEQYLKLYHAESERSNTQFVSKGFEFSILDELVRIQKAINIYIWCSKAQVRKIIEYYENKKCNVDILTWHKTNPIPTCNNTYLNDTEYLIFARQKGVKLLGTYHTKKKYYVTPLNVADKKLYGHPTIKPLEIIENLIINSSLENDIVLDCYMGSGTTGVACKNLNRRFIGIEIDENYFKIAKKRITGVENVEEI